MSEYRVVNEEIGKGENTADFFAIYEGKSKIAVSDKREFAELIQKAMTDSHELERVQRELTTLEAKYRKIAGELNSLEGCGTPNEFLKDMFSVCKDS